MEREAPQTMRPTVEPLPEAIAVNERSADLIETAAAIVVRSDLEYERAGEMSVEVQTRIKRIEEFRDRQLDDWREARRQALQSMDKLTADYEPILEPLRMAKAALVGACLGWRKEQEAKARLEAEKAQAEAILEAERARKETEKIAAKLERKGLEAEAEVIRARVLDVVAPVAAYQPPPPKVKGLAVKKEKRGRFDLRAQFERLAKAIGLWNDANPAEGLIPHNYWTLDEKWLQREIKRTDGMVAIPGVEFFDHEDLQPRTR